MSNVLVIAGPTATGKTAVAVDIAQRLRGELVGADSVQVYRGFDIGSAKPGEEELRGTTHHLIDILDPDEEIDAAEYARRADLAIGEILSRGKLPIVVGGTGLWIRALMRGLVDVPPVDPDVRARFEAKAGAVGSAALHAELRMVDPLTADAVHPNDQFRIVRALEVYEQTGVPLGELRRRHALGAPRYGGLFVVLDRAIDAHHTAITKRVDQMLEAGWVDEVRALRAQWGDQVKAFGSVGYREALAHVNEQVTLEETRRQIVKATRVYARRQRTWFRGEPGVDWRANADELRSQAGFLRVQKELAA